LRTPWFHLFVCHRQAPTRTNTPTNVPFCWDGERLVRSPTKDGFVILLRFNDATCELESLPKFNISRFDSTKQRSSTRQG
jgi:hypothetical protein